MTPTEPITVTELHDGVAVQFVVYNRDLVAAFRKRFPRALWGGGTRSWHVPGKLAARRVALWLEETRRTFGPGPHAAQRARDAAEFDGALPPEPPPPHIERRIAALRRGGIVSARPLVRPLSAAAGVRARTFERDDATDAAIARHYRYSLPPLSFGPPPQPSTLFAVSYDCAAEMLVIRCPDAAVARRVWGAFHRVDMLDNGLDPMPVCYSLRQLYDLTGEDVRLDGATVTIAIPARADVDPPDAPLPGPDVIDRWLQRWRIALTWMEEQPRWVARRMIAEGEAAPESVEIAGQRLDLDGMGRTFERDGEIMRQAYYK